MQQEFEKFWNKFGETFTLMGVDKESARLIFMCGGMSAVATGLSPTELLMEQINISLNGK